MSKKEIARRRAIWKKALTGCKLSHKGYLEGMRATVEER